MSTGQIHDHPDSNVIPLRTQDAGTEMRTVEAGWPGLHRPDGRPRAAQAIIPAHWRS
jgi:hypothetical protein